MPGATFHEPALGRRGMLIALPFMRTRSPVKSPLSEAIHRFRTETPSLRRFRSPPPQASQPGDLHENALADCSHRTLSRIRAAVAGRNVISVMSSSNLAGSFSWVAGALSHQRLDFPCFDIPLRRGHCSVSVSQAAAWTWPKPRSKGLVR